MRKAAKVINSCETDEQRETAAKYVSLMESAIYPDPMRKKLPKLNSGCVMAIVTGAVLAAGILFLVGWLLLQI